ncbi:hypothetical protein LZF95_15530 [Algoriphagus sp. AGSA1]|uniref:hypothetical protein n=1 Tax=Algoriphagus sp. AGSA1 TaxID=2907213 RepID=UPI001F44AB30|nr:hypothetical protein [Algoriphagus sp. AGSA1]MCE7056093.1 hypothetical protein [Algoriphagus sp. AGSA1]
MNVIICNDANSHILFVLLDGRQEAEAALSQMLSESYDAFIVLLVEKRISIKTIL